MRVSWLFLLCFLFPFITLAQSGVITGKVTRIDSKAPVPQANVFLSNSTAGTATNEEGSFTLSGLKPGQYTLVVTIVGYEDYTQSVLVGKEPIKLNIELATRNTLLHEVVISTDADWKKNYAQFVKDFIGTDDNAKYCVVMNPHAVTLVYHRSQQDLEAYTDDFLVVENHALGYRVKFLVKEFNSSKLSHIISYSGERLFEPLPGNKKQQEEWKKKREEAYYGSPMHFYRSLYTDKLGDEGFQMYRLTRMLNPNRPREEEIQQKVKYFSQQGKRDSVNYWISLSNLSKYYREDLSKDTLHNYDILYKTEKSGVFAVSYTGYYLYVVYTKKREETDFKDVYHSLDMPNYETSVVTLTKPYLFDTNGVVFGNEAPLYEGTWSKSKLSDLLPVDYTPGQ
ncbi:CarboxypepD_reg-like domain-containing protein [Mucilaginibacter mallensis]|uniref:CarboxypepD_reg-like domain-containing protein n=1 Tax=Mucilaginibacter mallensis TaxID=652787 RepID=A0A1H1VTT3_MUCMA|nr:carboxypeptidase-like regulatory domain-containing protein [Mucilaginibacter mallensis]SDS87891.1 CarboxypepD_reg-like domain-containing protein [Mucilaginibacter mallensis]